MSQSPANIPVRQMSSMLPISFLYRGQCFWAQSITGRLKDQGACLGHAPSLLPWEREPGLPAFMPHQVSTICSHFHASLFQATPPTCCQIIRGNHRGQASCLNAVERSRNLALEMWVAQRGGAPGGGHGRNGKDKVHMHACMYLHVCM